MNILANLHAMLERGQDNALLRFSLGNEYLKQKDFPAAIAHYAKALEFDRHYSAAWKTYAKALAENGQAAEATEAYRQGIAVAEAKGDMQAVKEMRVFLKRLEKQASSP
jgi:Tfp pilus assembly protein PilF